eukprot:PhM_4_TR18845/c1_g1_i1/m.100324
MKTISTVTGRRIIPMNHTSQHHYHQPHHHHQQHHQNQQQQHPSTALKKQWKQRAMSLRDVTDAHQQARHRIWTEYTLIPDIITLMGKWDAQHRPGTALHKTRTLLALLGRRPEGQVKVVMSCWRQRLGATGTRQAIAATPGKVRTAMRLADSTTARTILLLWVSASRHGDLARAHVSKAARTSLLLKWGTQKSDRFGERRITKFVHWPREVPARWASYKQVLRALKRVSLTVHSLRRGSLTWLAKKGYTHTQLQKLSGHTPVGRTLSGIRRYVDPAPEQPEGRLQMRMSHQLNAIVGGAQMHAGATRCL